MVEKGQKRESVEQNRNYVEANEAREFAEIAN
jgi:hypothetical protein